MTWTRETITDYVRERGECADLQYLIEAIEHIYPDAKSLIDEWYEIIESQQECE